MRGVGGLFQFRFRFGFLILFQLLLLLPQPALAGFNPGSWFDHSHSIFFPEALKKKLTVHQSFPLFWWNFFVLELHGQDDKADWPMVVKTCAYLKTQSALLARVECEQSLKEVQSLLSDWRQDYTSHYSRPKDAVLRSRFDAALAKATLPTGDADLLKLLRADPLESWHELQLLAEGRINLPLTRKSGFFYDAKTRRVVIPVQMTFGPDKTRMTADFQRELLKSCGADCVRWDFIGPHASTLKNELQIISDTRIVSRVGVAILAIFGCALLFTGRGRLFFLVPPVFLAMLVGAAVTIAVYGSIHDLTLSFGAGIIGLALDYGLQAAFNSRSPRIWRSNTFGMLTTIVGLVVVMTSAIPLLRQMMLFSSVGMLTAFGFFYLLLKRFPEYFATRELAATPRVRISKTLVVLALIGCSLVGAATLRPSLDMRQFDFQDARTKVISTWLFQNQMSRAPLFRIHEGDGALADATAEKIWAQGAKVKMENAANYLAPEAVQQSHLKTWSQAPCDKFRAKLTDTQKKFFAPFLDQQLCAAGAPLTLAPNAAAKPRSYLAHLVAGSEWITLFMPDTQAQETAVRAQYPDARSLKEIISIFPETLARELSWMAPLSVGLATVLLFLYYRRPRATLLALVPFFSGMGLVVVARLFLRFDLSFISVMALIMVFGFSIDYGIFATDVGTVTDVETEAGVWTGLGFAAFATVAGFVPMLFCKHPVLLHLGSTLFFGAVGTYLGAIWGIPGLRRLLT